MPQQHETGPLAILEALRSLDLDKLEEQTKNDLKGGSKSKRSEYVKRLNAIKGLRRTGVAPGELMITSVPVIPPKFRPFAQQGDTMIAGDANILYKDFIEQNDAFKQEREMFGDNNAGQGRLDLYDTAKALYGYGDPIKDKSKQKDVRGFLRKIVGRTSKQGFFQSKMIAKPMDSVGRSTIIVDPELGMDEIGLPKDLAMTMYAPHVQRRLRQSGLADTDALKHVKNMTPQALHALEKEMEVRPVVYSRAPAWYQHNIIGGNPKLIDGDAISISPAVTTGMGADFDGDTINVHVPASDSAVAETYKKLMPSSHPYDDRSGESIKPKMKQEQVLGMYDLATRPANGVYRFATQREALDAVKRGDVPLDADLDIDDLKGQEKVAEFVHQPIMEEPAVDLDSPVDEQVLKAVEIMYGVKVPKVVARQFTKARDLVGYVTRLGEMQKEAAGKIMKVWVSDMHTGSRYLRMMRFAVYMPDCAEYRDIIAGEDSKAKAELAKKFWLNRGDNVEFEECSLEIGE